MKDKTLESIFRQKLEDLSIEPSDRAKDLIQQRIKKRGRIILFRKLSVAASILLIMSLGIFYLLPANEPEPLVGQIEGAGEKQNPTINKNTNEKRESTEIPHVAQNLAQDEFETLQKKDPDQVDSRKSSLIVPEDSGTIDEDEPSPMVALSEDPSGNRNGSDSLHIASLEEQASRKIRHREEMILDPNKDQIIPPDVSADQATAKKEPMKITIEYIASGSKEKRSGTPKTQVGELYSKVNKLVYPDEVLGDIRSLKDQLFALEFINRKSTRTQNNKEK